MLSQLVIAFLPRSKHLLISWLQSPSAEILEPRNIKSGTVSPSICHEVMGSNTMTLVFWMLNFKPTFSLTSFTFIKRLFSSSLSAIRVLSSAYLRLLIFLLAILIPACASSSLAFWVIYCAYRASLVAQLVKNLPAMLETWVRSLGWEDSLEKGKATHSSILAWRISWTIQSIGSQRVRTVQLSLSLTLHRS